MTSREHHTGSAQELVYHGTTLENAKSIIREGFKLPSSSIDDPSAGIFFTGRISAAAGVPVENSLYRTGTAPDRVAVITAILPKGVEQSATGAPVYRVPPRLMSGIRIVEVQEVDPSVRYSGDLTDSKVVWRAPAAQAE